MQRALISVPGTSGADRKFGSERKCSLGFLFFVHAMTGADVEDLQPETPMG